MDVGVAVDGWDKVGVDLEYVTADGFALCRPLAECLSVRFEGVEPARSFPTYRGQRNFPGWWWSSTMSRHVGFESWLERDHVMLLDFDPRVAAFASQPFWLNWPAAGRVRRHLPDFFARQVDGVGVVIDVRADDRIEPADAEAFAATAAVCEAVGWQFRRVGTLDGVFAANVRWLSRYRHPRCGRREDVIVRLLEVFAQPTPLFAGAERVGDRLLVLPVLYHLLWCQALIVDLRSALLGASTLVWRGQRRWS